MCVCECVRLCVCVYGMGNVWVSMCGQVWMDFGVVSRCGVIECVDVGGCECMCTLVCLVGMLDMLLRWICSWISISSSLHICIIVICIWPCCYGNIHVYYNVIICISTPQVSLVDGIDSFEPFWVLEPKNSALTGKGSPVTSQQNDPHKFGE